MKKNATKKLAENLKKIRESKNISQVKLERLSGVSWSYISSIENNNRKAVSVETLCALCEGLDVDPDTLLGWRVLDIEEDD